MEALLLMLDGIAMLVLVYMGLRDERAPPGAPHRSVFRMVEQRGKAAPGQHPGASNPRAGQPSARSTRARGDA